MTVEDQTVSFSLEVNVEAAATDIRRLQTVLYRTLSLASRLTGDEDLRRGMQTMQRAIMIANQLRLAYAALQAARLAAGDPLAWALAGVAVAEFGVSTYEMVNR